MMTSAQANGVDLQKGDELTKSILEYRMRDHQRRRNKYRDRVVRGENVITGYAAQPCRGSTLSMRMAAA